jgi:hypothetical protein
MRVFLFLLFLASPLLANQRVSGWCEQGNQTISVLGYTSSTATPVQASYPSCTVTVYVSGTESVSTAQYISGGTITGTIGQTVTLTFNGGSGGAATATLTSTCSLPCSGTSAIATGSALLINTGGTGFTGPPTTATCSSGTATCSGTMVVTSTTTGTLATLYSNNSGSSLTNPFTATTGGYWYFYVANGRYDVQQSGSGLTSPFTLGDNQAFDYTTLGGTASSIDAVNLKATPGIQCDGTTDDTTLAQSTINAAASANYPIKLCPSTMIVTSLVLPSNAHIQGYGPNLSVIKLKPNSATANTPWITSTGTSYVTIEGVTIDGNTANQSGVTSNVNNISFTNVSHSAIRNSSIINAGSSLVYGSTLTDFTMQGNYLSNWGPGNVKAVLIAAYQGTGPTSGIKFLNNTCDGTVSGSTCFNVSASPTYPASGILTLGNTIKVGASTAPTIGVEFFPTATDSSFVSILDTVTANNTITCAAGSTGGEFGVSLGGGQRHLVQGNTIYGCITYSVEMLTPNSAAVANIITDSGQLSESLGGTTFNGVVIKDNVITLNSSTGIPAIKLYVTNSVGVGGVLNGARISGNSITFKSTTGAQPAIWLQSSGSLSSINGTDISDNFLYGDGTAGIDGISLEVDSGAITHTVLGKNYLDNFAVAISEGGDTNTVRDSNTFGPLVATNYGGSPGSVYTIDTSTDSQRLILSGPTNGLRIGNSSGPIIDNQSGGILIQSSNSSQPVTLSIAGYHPFVAGQYGITSLISQGMQSNTYPPTFTVSGSGCSIPTVNSVGGNVAGTFTANGSGTCTYTLILSNGFSYTNGPVCDNLADETTPASAINVSRTPNSATFQPLAVTNGDRVHFSCLSGF